MRRPVALALVAASFALAAPALAQAPMPAPAPFPQPAPGAPGVPGVPGLPGMPAMPVMPGMAPYAPGPAPLGPQPGYAPAPYGYAPPPPAVERAGNVEMGFLYAAAATWGVGTGVWIDAVGNVGDPGIRFVAPTVLGVAAPATVFVLDRTTTIPRGLPSSIATGIFLGGAEGVGIAATQYTRTADADSWGFKGLATSSFLGATVGGAAGAGLYYLARPTPRTNLFFMSAAFWGAAIGTEFGAAASNGSFGAYTNDGMALGSLIGFNTFALGGAAVSLGWVPTYRQMGFMWGGFAIASVATLPVYAFYYNSDYDPRRGLIFQGVAGTVGVIAGALLGYDANDRSAKRDDEPSVGEKRSFARVLGGSVAPVPGGASVNVVGELF